MISPITRHLTLLLLLTTGLCAWAGSPLPAALPAGGGLPLLTAGSGPERPPDPRQEVAGALLRLGPGQGAELRLRVRAVVEGDPAAELEAVARALAEHGWEFEAGAERTRALAASLTAAGQERAPANRATPPAGPGAEELPAAAGLPVRLAAGLTEAGPGGFTLAGRLHNPHPEWLATLTARRTITAPNPDGCGPVLPDALPGNRPHVVLTGLDPDPASPPICRRVVRQECDEAERCREIYLRTDVTQSWQVAYTLLGPTLRLADYDLEARPARGEAAGRR